MKADLHSHTIYSDGICTPEELIVRAKNNHVDILAITDHDSVLGAEKVYNEGLKYGVKVIKGLELSTKYKGNTVHLVCLCKENKINDGLYKFSHDFVESRNERAIKMMNNIRDIYGLKVDVAKLICNDTAVTRANMCRHLMEYNNLSWDEAWFYCSNKSKAYISSAKLSSVDAAKFAHDNGCLVILAHPCLIENQDVIDELIIESKVDGIEAIYPSSKNDEAKYRKYAEKYNLFVSAGSDCHGDNTHADVGTCSLDENEFKIIQKLLNI